MMQVVREPVAEAVQVLAAELLDRYGARVAAILMYGSCLRTGDPYEGLVDLYVLVDEYEPVYGRRWLALANRLLPPNVFYFESEHRGRKLRSKYAVITFDGFHWGIHHWFHSYLWGRFSQPCRLIYSRDPAVADAVVRSLIGAARRLIRETVPVLPPCFDIPTLWRIGLALSYRSELRAEKAEVRAAELYRWAAPFYARLTPSLLTRLPCPVKPTPTGFCLEIPPSRRLLARWKWRLRQVQGKLLSLLRLIKALFTFQGGVDYILWKLERHTGQTIEVPSRVYRHPLIYGWGVLWRLYRRGAFR